MGARRPRLAVAEPFPSAPPALRDKARGDLARSGVTLELAEILGVELVNAARMRELGHADQTDGVAFWYWDPFDENFLRDFHRVRLLDNPAPAGFGAQQKPRRYSQPPGTLNSVYIPRAVRGEPYDWKAHLSSPATDLLITEGEKKAILACHLGFPCLGLGGVDVFQARRKGAASLPLLDKIEWRGRRVTVVFDTDEEGGMKDAVLAAARRLLDWLLLRGAVPYLLVLPGRPGEKVGLDDYLLEHGVDGFQALMLSGCMMHSDATEILKAATNYRYITEIDRFVGDDPHLLMGVEHLDRVMGNKLVALPRMVTARDGSGAPTTKLIPKPVRLADALLIWPGTERFGTMVYEPGAARVVRRAGGAHLNLWRGWRCEPPDGCWPARAAMERAYDEWRWALDNVFGCDPVAREYAEGWLLYPLAVPGAKLNTHVLLCSREKGIGKSFLGHMMAKHVYGLVRPGARHAWQLSEGDLTNTFNPFLFATSFVEGDDIVAHDRIGAYKRISSYITSDTIQINIKNNPQFMVDNRANFWLTSNSAAPFFLDEDERRAFIHVPRNPRKNQERYHALQLLFDEGVAGPAILRHARERFDRTRFDPLADAPMTRGKREVALNGRSGPREWVHDLIANADMLTRPFATAREVIALMESERVAGRANPDSVGHLLREAGAVRWGDGVQLTVRWGDGQIRRERAWVLGRFADVWEMPRARLEDALSTTAFGYAAPARGATPREVKATVVRLPRGKKF